MSDFGKKAKSIIILPGGMPKHKPHSRELLGAGPVVVMNTCMVDGCGQAFESDKKEIVCPRCKGVIGMAVEAVGDAPVGNMPKNMGRVESVGPVRGGKA